MILETNDRIGASWRNRWSSLRLFTPARYSGLPGWAFPGARWSYPTKDEVADYLEAYAARFELQVRAGVRVDCLLREADRYILTMGPRRLEADQVVVASGAYHSPFVPDFPSELDPSIVQLHSRECRDPSQLRDGGVLVVGAGNSGAEIAADVSSTHRTWISGRDTGHLPFHPGTVWDRLFTPLIWFMGSRVLTLNTPIGRKVRPKALSMGHPLEQVQPHDLAAAGVQRVPRTAGVRDGFPVLDDGRVLHVSNVIWCTGFRPDFGWINRPAFDETGEPVHDRGVVRSEPGLYFVGRFFQHSLTSSLIGGVGEDAAYIARHLATQPTRVERPSSAGRRSSGGFAESHDV